MSDVAMRKRRREKGEGSISQRKDGLWQFSIDLGGLGPDGRRRRRYVYARSKSALLKKIADERAIGGGSLKPAASGSVAEWVTRWLEITEPTVRPNTFAAREIAWRVHAAPFIGYRKLEKIWVDDVDALYDELKKKGTGGRSIQIVAQVMRLAFDEAIARRKYFQANPFKIAKIPKHKPRKARVLTQEEVARFMDASRSDRYDAMWMLLLNCGLRLGEAAALRWDHVNLETGRITVDQQTVEIHGRVSIADPKTDESERILEIGASALKSLRRRRAAADKETHSSPYVFPSSTGALMNRTNLRKRHFQAVTKAARLTGLRPHDLRHTMTSVAMASGISPIVVASRLGHASTRLSMDRYGHVMPGQQRAAADAIEAAMAPKKGRPSRAKSSK